jgi:class 3 adenylate cyclase
MVGVPFLRAVPTCGGPGDVPTVHYLPEGMTVEVRPGETLLDGARRAGVPHAAACGGEGLCSTCRVLVLDGGHHLSAPTDEERSISTPLGFGAEIRLACQSQASGSVTVRRLVLDPRDEAMADQRRSGPAVSPVGEQADIAVLVADLRDFTAFSEALVPYDVIHVLNRFFEFSDEIVAGEGGRIATYLGDGFMAIFGGEAGEPAERAVRAGLGILDVADLLQPYVEQLHGTGFGISVGINYGRAVIGAVGTGESRVVTAIGDTVNTAARIEWANRIHGTRLLIGESVRQAVSDRFELGAMPPIDLPGKSGHHILYEVAGPGRGTAGTPPN